MSITTNVYHYSLTRGDTHVHRITVKNTDESVKDITGATARYTVRAYTYAGAVAIEKTTSSGISLTTPASGILDVTLDPADTAALTPNIRYVYDCELTLGGQVQTVQTGTIAVVGDESQ